MSASRPLHDRSQDIGRLVVLPAWCCFAWVEEVTLCPEEWSKKRFVYTDPNTFSFLPLSPKFDVISSYTCRFPGIWAAARTPSGCCQSGSRHLCRSGSRRRECYPHQIQHSISTVVRARNHISPTPALWVRKGKHIIKVP